MARRREKKRHLVGVLAIVQMPDGTRRTIRVRTSRLFYYDDRAQIFSEAERREMKLLYLVQVWTEIRYV